MADDAEDAACEMGIHDDVVVTRKVSSGGAPLDGFALSDCTKRFRARDPTRESVSSISRATRWPGAARVTFASGGARGARISGEAAF